MGGGGGGRGGRTPLAPTTSVARAHAVRSRGRPPPRATPLGSVSSRPCRDAFGAAASPRGGPGGPPARAHRAASHNPPPPHPLPPHAALPPSARGNHCARPDDTRQVTPWPRGRWRRGRPHQGQPDGDACGALLVGCYRCGWDGTLAGEPPWRGHRRRRRLPLSHGAVCWGCGRVRPQCCRVTGCRRRGQPLRWPARGPPGSLDSGRRGEAAHDSGCTGGRPAP